MKAAELVERRLARRPTGFTLIELLTVIAIIAILVAILFPVMAIVRNNARRGQCVANLHQLAQALKMYRDIYGVHPEHLLGYRVSAGGCDPAPSTTVDITFLYPTFVKELNIFRCPNSRFQTTMQVYQQPTFGPTGAADPTKCFPAWDSYDGQFSPNVMNVAAALPPYELHYLRKWTPGPPGPLDSQRQLIYRQPSDQTVVTWCLYHASYEDPAPGSRPKQGEIALVLFLDGRVKSIPAIQLTNWTQMDGRNWQVRPGD